MTGLELGLTAFAVFGFLFLVGFSMIKIIESVE